MYSIIFYWNMYVCIANLWLVLCGNIMQEDKENFVDGSNTRPSMQSKIENELCRLRYLKRNLKNYLKEKNFELFRIHGRKVWIS